MTNVYTNLSFEWDLGNWPKCGKHGLSKEVIEYALNAVQLVREVQRRADSERRFQAVCLSPDGAYVFIVFVVRNRRIRPVSARPMHMKEVQKYEKDSQRKG
ncbi:MAG: BrnT family toxin [PS1 clade bacterium]|uniref:BrnT family toxin n=1 Tax=PS1 clade bacterium TaxID=2175152 RepID=A0A937HBM6_9PROT|nr:BrnT family toxin [PS1 clade bacterium]